MLQGARRLLGECQWAPQKLHRAVLGLGGPCLEIKSSCWMNELSEQRLCSDSAPWGGSLAVGISPGRTGTVSMDKGSLNFPHLQAALATAQ